MSRRALILLGLAACYRHVDMRAGDGGSLDDAMGDTIVIDGPCYGRGLGVRVCATDPSMRSYPADATQIVSPTDCSYMVTQTSGPALCVVAAQSITITGPVRLAGTLPIVLFATDSIDVTLNGYVEAGTNRGGNANGPGSDYTCASPNKQTGRTSMSVNTGGGGGAGGSFQGFGGSGGPGVSTLGGMFVVEPAPTFVRGGCAGGDGGADSAGSGGGTGGHSGGAVYFLAGNAIQIDGHVDAIGEGGGAPDSTSAAGGGAGGSGGLLVFDAPSVVIAGTVLATGGGGGGGGGNPGTTETAQSGADPSSPSVAPAGGTGAAPGGNGGDGSYRTNSNGIAGTTGSQDGSFVGSGGGGGGGGAGYIYTFSTTLLQLSASIAPQPISN